MTEDSKTKEQIKDNINEGYCELRPKSHLNIVMPVTFKLPSPHVVFVLPLLKIEDHTSASIKIDDKINFLSKFTIICGSKNSKIKTLS